MYNLLCEYGRWGKSKKVAINNCVIFYRMFYKRHICWWSLAVCRSSRKCERETITVTVSFYYFFVPFFALQALELLNAAQRHKTKTVIFLSPTHTALNDNFSDCFGLEMESATKQNKSQNINYYSLLPSNVW